MLVRNSYLKSPVSFWFRYVLIIVVDRGLFRVQLQGVPLAINFINRPAEATEMERCLLPRHATQPQSPRIFVLHGLGGIGKTKLAAAFARQHQREFSAVFWLDGRSEDQLKQSLSSCARRIPQGQIPDKSRDVIPKSEDELNIVVRDVLGWLSQSENRSWLLIFDNVDLDNEQGGLTSKYDIQQYLPGSNGSVLITSRLERLAQLGESREVKRGNADLSKAIFQEWYGAEFSK